jgi:hypothetical protein
LKISAESGNVGRSSSLLHDDNIKVVMTIKINAGKLNLCFIVENDWF